MKKTGHFIQMTPEQLKFQIELEQNFKVHCNACNSNIAIGEYLTHIGMHMLDTKNNQQDDNASE